MMAIGAMFSTTLATPVAVGEADLGQRGGDATSNIEARQSLIPGLPTLQPIVVPSKPDDLVPALANAMSQAFTILGALSKLLISFLCEVSNASSQELGCLKLSALFCRLFLKSPGSQYHSRALSSLKKLAPLCWHSFKPYSQKSYK
jgi:hypothetical protein